MPDLFLALLMVVAAGAAWFWWLRHVPKPEWREVAFLAILLLGVALAAVVVVREPLTP